MRKNIRVAVYLTEKMRFDLERIASYRDVKISHVIRQMIVEEANRLIEFDAVEANDDLRVIFDDYKRNLPYHRLAQEIFGARNVLVQDPAAIIAVVNALPAAEKKIIEMHFGLGRDRKCYSLRQIGDIAGITLTCVRRIKHSALRRMRDLIRREEISGCTIAQVPYTPEEMRKLQDRLTKEQEEATALRCQLAILRKKFDFLRKTWNDLLLICQPEDYSTMMTSSGILEDLGLSIRVYNSLSRSGIHTIAELQDALRRGDEEILAKRNIGERALAEIKNCLDLYLRGDRENHAHR